tara:strand:- start:42167 stop:42919 length:753 start_codon:yes stop_codon:yes gene_type:complete
MDIYSDASVVTVDIPYVNEDGTPVLPIVASYRVYDQDSVAIVSPTAITLGANPVEVTVTVDGSLNTLVDEVRILRVIEVTMTNAENETSLTTYTYVVEAPETLVVGVNSYQSTEGATLLSMEIARITGWEASTARQRVAALAEAYVHMGKMNYLDEGTTIQTLNEYTEAELLALSTPFSKALKLAQIAQANYLLGGDEEEKLREAGLMSKSVGESSEMFRSGKPLTLPICRRSLKFLQGYVSYGVTMGRS